MQEPDPGLVAAARRGDLRAFEQLVRLGQADVLRLCLHLLGERQAAEDAAQETFVRAFRFLPRYRGDASFSTWLLAIARNCALDEARRAARRQLAAATARAQPPPGPVRSERALEVREALRALSLPLREAVVLVDVLGLSYAQAAAAAGAPLGTLKSRVHRARELLAEALSEDAEGTGGAR